MQQNKIDLLGRNRPSRNSYNSGESEILKLWIKYLAGPEFDDTFSSLHYWQQNKKVVKVSCHHHLGASPFFHSHSLTNSWDIVNLPELLQLFWRRLNEIDMDFPFQVVKHNVSTEKIIQKIHSRPQYVQNFTYLGQKLSEKAEKRWFF